MTLDFLQGRHNEREFADLLQRSGLSDLVVKLKNMKTPCDGNLRIFYFSPMDGPSPKPPTGYSRDFITGPGRPLCIFLNQDDMWKDKPDAPRETCFMIQLLHEAGHFVADTRGLNPSCELLAWHLAETLCPIAIPAEWSSFRDHALGSYTLVWDS